MRLNTTHEHHALSITHACTDQKITESHLHDLFASIVRVNDVVENGDERMVDSLTLDTTQTSSGDSHTDMDHSLGMHVAVHHDRPSSKDTSSWTSNNVLRLRGGARTRLFQPRSGKAPWKQLPSKPNSKNEQQTRLSSNNAELEGEIDDDDNVDGDVTLNDSVTDEEDVLHAPRKRPACDGCTRGGHDVSDADHGDVRNGANGPRARDEPVHANRTNTHAHFTDTQTIVDTLMAKMDECFTKTNDLNEKENKLKKREDERKQYIKNTDVIDMDAMDQLDEDVRQLEEQKTRIENELVMKKSGMKRMLKRAIDGVRDARSSYRIKNLDLVESNISRLKRHVDSMRRIMTSHASRVTKSGSGARSATSGYQRRRVVVSEDEDDQEYIDIEDDASQEEPEPSSSTTVANGSTRIRSTTTKSTRTEYRTRSTTSRRSTTYNLRALKGKTLRRRY